MFSVIGWFLCGNAQKDAVEVGEVIIATLKGYFKYGPLCDTNIV